MIPPPPPPMRTFRQGLFSFKETKESIKATKKWELLMEKYK